jgi:hypothetical protein
MCDENVNFSTLSPRVLKMNAHKSVYVGLPIKSEGYPNGMVGLRLGRN